MYHLLNFDVQFRELGLRLGQRLLHVGSLFFRLSRIEHLARVSPQTSQDAGNDTQVVEPSALGTSLERNRHSGVFTADFDEQQRFIDHALPDSGVGLLIVF